MCLARQSLENSEFGRRLAPGGGDVPPGGLDRFRLAALGDALGENSAVYDLFALLLSDDAWIGRCCAMSG